MKLEIEDMAKENEKTKRRLTIFNNCTMIMVHKRTFVRIIFSGGEHGQRRKDERE